MFKSYKFNISRLLRKSFRYYPEGSNHYWYTNRFFKISVHIDIIERIRCIDKNARSQSEHLAHYVMNHNIYITFIIIYTVILPSSGGNSAYCFGNLFSLPLAVYENIWYANNDVISEEFQRLLKCLACLECAVAAVLLSPSILYQKWNA